MRKRHTGRTVHKSYYLFNAHGDVVQLTDAAGGVTQTYDYYAFGNQKTETPADANPFRYCGEYFDAETGTIYLRARYYDPSVGRFTQQDPAGDGLNWYTYCNGNPIIYSDPNGHFAVTTAVLVATGAAILIGGIFDIASGAAGVRTQGMFDDPSLYNVADWATMGTVDMVKGAFAPEDPLSFEHWMDSFGTVALIYGAYGQIEKGFPSKSTKNATYSVDFYVTPDGEVIPATGYRYISENATYLDDMEQTMRIPANENNTYFSFNNFANANPGALQVPHDATIKVTFNTLQIVDDISIPYGKWGKAGYLEPITKDFPQFGYGGATQVITKKQIVIDSITKLPKYRG